MKRFHLTKHIVVHSQRFLSLDEVDKWLKLPRRIFFIRRDKHMHYRIAKVLE